MDSLAAARSSGIDVRAVGVYSGAYYRARDLVFRVAVMGTTVPDFFSVRIAWTKQPADLDQQSQVPRIDWRETERQARRVLKRMARLMRGDVVAEGRQLFKLAIGKYSRNRRGNRDGVATATCRTARVVTVTLPRAA